MVMDVLLLSRLQFAFTICFHYIYPPLSIGLGVNLVIMEGLWLLTRDPAYYQMARFWAKIFALTFAMGVATGIVMEFEFGTNWATYSRYVGDVFGSTLAAEGIFAFFLESGFLAVVLFGWDRVGPKFHFFSTCMVCLGSHFSAVWIVVANSWMQTPAGFRIVGEGMQARAQVADFWAMVFNPSMMDRLAHTIIAAWQAGAWLVVSVSAYYLLRKCHIDFAQRSFKMGISVAFVSALLQLVSGDSTAKGVALNQPAKLAAIEGLFHTEVAPLSLFGWVDEKNGKIDGVEIPYLLTFLTYRDFTTPVAGLDKVPKADRAPVGFVFQTYHGMVAIGMAMIGLGMLGVFLWWRGLIFSDVWWMRRFVLPAMVVSVLGPQIANQLGWMTAEVGRQPWIVYGLLRTSEGLSKTVKADAVLGSLVLFTFIYVFLFALFIFLLNEKLQHGPELERPAHEGKVADALRDPQHFDQSRT
jgi:cytochrome d ubiquinol oxidase subunit I